MLDSSLVEQCRVTEVVGHHDGGVKRREVQGGNWGVIVSRCVNRM